MPTLRLLGPPTWRRPDGTPHALGPERRHQLLALLGYEAQWVGRDRLAALFWPERPDRAARANLRKVLHELRALNVPGLEDGPEGLRWLPGSDVDSFRHAWQRGDWQQAADAGHGPLMQGLDDALGGTAFGDWLRGERAGWHQRWRDAALKAAAVSDAERAWQLAQRLLQAELLDSEAMALALRSAAALGRPELAQPWWQRHVQQLQAEQGVAPPPTLGALARGEAPPGIAPLAPLVGRGADLQELAALLAHGRLVTVLGPGGVGKTRLARHAADAVAARFAGGVAFVALEDAHTPDELPARIAAATGPPLGVAGDVLPLLARRLAPLSLLLVLDGFEAVIDAGPALLTLLAAAPGLRVMVTSRERLAVDGEWLLPLTGLDVPAPGASAEAVLQSQAGALFVARARAVNPAFDAVAASPAVARICRHLDGLPLALELAAAWARVLPAADIAAELAQGLDFLGRGQGVDLDAVFARSWALLTAGERDAQARLAVFRGGFTRAAAKEAAGVDLPMLAALLDKSMLQSQADGRFGMHALLHPQALLKLQARPDAAAAFESHSRWFLALTLQPGAELSAERDNLLAAWQQAVARRDAQAVEAVLFTLPWASVVRGRLDEAARLLGDAARAFGADPLASALLSAHRAWMLLWQSQRPAARDLAQAALAPLRAAGHAAGIVMAQRTLGHAARLDGHHAQAAAHLAEGVAVAQEAGLGVLEAVMHDGLAMALNMLGRHAEARQAVAAAEALHHGGGDTVQRVYNLYNRAQSH
jgi:DNA-binding SARP family transcriptional activator